MKICMQGGSGGINVVLIAFNTTRKWHLGSSEISSIEAQGNYKFISQ